MTFKEIQGRFGGGPLYHLPCAYLILAFTLIVNR